MDKHSSVTLRVSLDFKMDNSCTAHLHNTGDKAPPCHTTKCTSTVMHSEQISTYQALIFEVSISEHVQAQKVYTYMYVLALNYISITVQYTEIITVH